MNSAWWGKAFRIALRVAVTLGLLSFLVYWIGLSRIVQSLALLDLRVVPLLMAALALSHLANGFTLMILSRRVSIGWKPAFWISLRSWSWGQYTPARIGESSMVLYLHDLGISWGESASILLLNRAAVLLLLCFVAVAGMWAFGPGMLEVQWALVAIGVFLGVAALGFVLVWRRAGEVILGRRFGEHMVQFKHSLRSLLMNPLAMAGLLSTQLIKLLLLFGITKLLFVSIGAHVPYWHVCAINSAARIAALLPVSINGLGVREGVQVWLYAGISGVETSAIISVALAADLVLYASAGFVMLFLPRRRWLREPNT